MERAQLQLIFKPPETPREPMEFLSRSWSLSAHEISKTLAPPPAPELPAENNPKRGAVLGAAETIHEDADAELPTDPAALSANLFSFSCSQTFQLIMERIMSQSQEVSPRTSGRLSHSSGPLTGALTDSPPVSPSELDDDSKYLRMNIPIANHHKSSAGSGSTAAVNGSGKTVGRWLKDRREKKKEETRTHNAQLHAAISVAGVAAAIAAITASTTATSSGGKVKAAAAKTSMALASAATLVAAQCVEAAEAMGADRDDLASVVSSAVNVRSAGDIMTLTAAAATALRGAATLKARVLKDAWNLAAVIPVDKGTGVATGGNGDSNGSSKSGSFSDELFPEENFLGICSRELLARGCELLKKTRKGDLHWKIVSVFINRMGQVMLKMKSRHVAGTVTKKKKNIVVEVLKDIPAWPGRHLLEDGEHRQHFALNTIGRGVVEFECRNQRDYDIWTQGVSRLLTIATDRNNRHRI